MNLRPFHLAIPVTDIEIAHDFYVKKLDCKVGRQSREWMDFDFFGHQLVAHLVPMEKDGIPCNPVDGEDVPSRHFGIVLKMYQWEILRNKLTSKDIKFIIEPSIRFKDEKGEQATLFIQDPSGNVLEFKAFKNDSMIFET